MDLSREASVVAVTVELVVAVVVCAGAGIEVDNVGNGSVLSTVGVAGVLVIFLGPSGSSSARKLARSTSSRKPIAASRFVMQYAASPSILLEARNLCMKHKLLIMLIPSMGDVIKV